MNFNEFLEKTTYEELSKISTIYLLLKDKDESKNLLQVIEKSLSKNKLGDAFFAIHLCARTFLAPSPK